MVRFGTSSRLPLSLSPQDQERNRGHQQNKRKFSASDAAPSQARIVRAVWMQRRLRSAGCST
jgi:hypothetical protein